MPKKSKELKEVCMLNIEAGLARDVAIWIQTLADSLRAMKGTMRSVQGFFRSFKGQIRSPKRKI